MNIFVVWAASALLLSASKVPDSTSAVPQAPSVAQAQAIASNADFTDAVRSAMNAALRGDFQGVVDGISPIVNDPGFSSRPPKVQYALLVWLGSTEVSIDDWGAATDTFARTVQLSTADATDWRRLLEVASKNNDLKRQSDAIIAIANKWPESITQDDDGKITRLHNALFKSKQLSEDFALLTALDRINWKSQNLSENTTYMWRDFALEALQRNDQALALKAVEKVADINAMISIRVDRRFDNLIALERDRFDVAAAAEAEVARLTAFAKAHPRQLGGLIAQAQALESLGRYQEALAALDQAESKLSKASFDDLYQNRTWLLDERSRVLRKLGRTDEALNELERASRLPERGDPNVSQVINLADFYVDIDRPKEALRTLTWLRDAEPSPYGLQSWSSAKIRALIKLNDPDAKRELEVMRARNAFAFGPTTAVLIALGDADGLAKYYIQLLDDPDRRIDTLIELQTYRDFSSTKSNNAAAHLKEAVLHRPDVQAAISKVGRIENQPVIADAE